jgi:hypothetical protein
MHLLEINKPQARISGVEISMCYPIDSKTCIEVTTCVDRLVPWNPGRQLKITWFCDLTVQVCILNHASTRWPSTNQG